MNFKTLLQSMTFTAVILMASIFVSFGLAELLRAYINYVDSGIINYKTLLIGFSDICFWMTAILYLKEK